MKGQYRNPVSETAGEHPFSAGYADADAQIRNWHGKPYYSLDAWCKNTLHRKCYKIALNAHMTCPNRDGSAGTRGCIFCSAGGSGEFAVSTEGRSVAEQLAEGEALLSRKVTLPQDIPCVIAYFQAYTNTYAPLEYLEQIFSQTLSSSRVCGISIATRPDCLPDQVLSLLSSLKERFPDKFVWVELGLQTIHETTALFIRRGYDLSCFEDAFRRLRDLEIPVILHTILGLPGESREQTLETISYVNRLRPFGIKLQLLHVLRDTDLAAHYAGKEFQVLKKEEYLDLTIDCLERLSPEIVIHRVTGDGPKNLLIAPLWSTDKRSVLNELHRKCKERGALQGRCSAETALESERNIIMLQDSLTINKLIVLYMLNRVNFSMTTAQVSDFILEKDYMNFLTLQQVISELTEAKMVSPKTIRNRTQLSITEEGRSTLGFFENHISEAIKEDINSYFREKEYALRNEVSILGDYYKSTSGEYEAHLVAKDRGIRLVDITLSVPSKEIASAICDNWQKKNQEIYQFLVQQLF